MNNLRLFLIFIGFISGINAQETISELVPAAYKNHPEYGKIKLDKDPSTFELIHLRTANARTFVDRNGQYHTQQTGGYFHFRNSKNEWISIQEEVSEDKSNPSMLGIFQSEMPMTVNAVNGATQMMLEKNGRSVTYGNQATMRYLDKDNQPVRSNTSNRQISHFSHDEHEIVLNDFFPAIDRIQTLEYWSLETDYRINSKLELPEEVQYVEFADEMQLPSGWQLEYAEGEMSPEGWQGTLQIVNEKGAIVSKISKPLYYDAFESTKRDGLNGHYGMGAYQIEKTASGYRLKLLVPAAWLNSDALVYPLTIDPTATNTYANNQAVQDKDTHFNSNCQATMDVTMPAGVYQVTGTNTSWRMWAKGFIYTNNYADREEQRSRVGAHLTGTSWTATQNGSGTNFSGSGYTYTSANNGQSYSLNNQSIANGCYNTSTITYIWQGYQSFFPHGSSAPAAARVTGCVTNYQELVVNTWIVTTTYNMLTMSMTATPTDQTICSGHQTGITLSSATANTTYAWSVAQSGTSGGANGGGAAITQTLSTTGAAAGTATYTVTPTYGTCPGTPVTVVITVNPGPLVNAGPDQTICPGQQVTLAGSGADSYAWDNGVTDGQPFVPGGAGTYTVTGTAAGCTATDQVTISMGALSTLNAGTDQSICTGQSVTLTATGATTYNWDHNVVNGTAFTPTTTTTYTVTGEDVGGCSNTDQVTITVNPLPVVSAGADQSVCSGASVTLTGTGATTYTWDNSVVNGVAFAPTATTTYTVTGTASGCSGTDQVTVTVTSLPSVSAGNDIVICQGAPVVLSGSGATTFVWDNNVTNGVAFIPSATAAYTVTGTTAGCTGTDQVLVTITPTPVVSFVPDITSGCLPLTVTFTGDPQASGNTCQWIFGDGSTGTGCGTVTHTYTSPGCFDVTLISSTSNGCAGQLVINDLVCTAPDPVAEFTPNPGILSVMDAYTSMVNTSTGAATYFWNFGDGTATSNLENPGHLFPNEIAGSYQVMLIAYSDFGCVDTALVNVEVQDELIYYVPNAFTPDDDAYNPVFKPVFTTGFDPYDYTLLIFNRWGEIVFESHNALVGWDGTYGESGKLVQDGTYAWRIDFKTTRTDERKLIAGNVTLIR